MKVLKATDYNQLSTITANIIKDQINSKANSVLGLATGSSPIGTYKKLIEFYNNGDVNFSSITSINLDEYKGLKKDNDQSYWFFMHQQLFDHVNVNPCNIFLPDGMNPDEDNEGPRYDGIINDKGPIDLQLLGIGHNGHIGFNEPGDSFVKETHCVDLSLETIKANTRFFENESLVPKKAYTVGMGAIMSASHVVIIASGAEKAEIIKKAFTGPITTMVPASILQLHPNVTLIGDESALSLL